MLWEEFQNFFCFPCSLECCQVSSSSTEWASSHEPLQRHPAALFRRAKSETAVEEMEMGPDDGAGLLRLIWSNVGLTIAPVEQDERPSALFCV